MLQEPGQRGRLFPDLGEEQLAGPMRLRDFGVPEADLPEVAADAAQRGGNLANPKPAAPQEIEQLLREVF